MFSPGSVASYYFIYADVCPHSDDSSNFFRYSVEGGRNSASDTANISLRDLDEYYFPPLKACIDQADVGAIMCSYSSINGTASCGNEWLNIDVARDN